MSDMESQPIIRIWTDGSCLVNPGGPGGWAYLIQGADGRTRSAAGSETSTTNNRMELLAAICALEAVAAGSMVEVTSDSEYVVQGASKWVLKWYVSGLWTPSGLKKKNRDLWERLIAARDRLSSVHWRWVRGHSGDPNNETVDRLAGEAAALVTVSPEMATRIEDAKSLMRWVLANRSPSV